MSPSARSTRRALLALACSLACLSAAHAQPAPAAASQPAAKAGPAAAKPTAKPSAGKPSEGRPSEGKPSEGKPSASPLSPADRAYIERIGEVEALVDDEARCKGYPDLPDNQWLAGAAQGRCSLLRKPAWSLEQIDRLLGEKDGAAELDRRFAELLDQHYRVQAQREQIFRAFKAFDASARAGETAQRWLRASPRSAYARVAVASHYQTIGEDARGISAYSQVGDAQRQDMQSQFAKALPLYDQALELEPRLSVACVQQMAIGRHVSQELWQRASERCRAIDPDSYYVVYGRILASQPNWGGSMQALREAVEDARQRASRNPILGAVVGEAEGFPVSPISGAPMVAAELARVSKLAPSGTLMSYAARAYGQDGDHWRTFVYASQAVRFWPHNAEFRNLRATALMMLNIPGWAAIDLEQAVRDAPRDPDVRAQLIKVLTLAGRADDAIAQLQPLRALSPQEAARTRFFVCGQLAQGPQYGATAVRCVNELVAEAPEIYEATQMRAFVLLQARDPGAAAAIDAVLDWPDPDGSAHVRAAKERARMWKADLETNKAALPVR
ncbi:tetratricopeptide repeat protein [Lysobacter enzymogenes]|uniref:tetratricopeptide repeat protein n=1 Tax=Lysobacter enzymogenes TaxID=69 RepID=UPI001AF38FC8|nr:hypothetical protein [Lysobacter enzymogenes]QQP99422.1 hypothetical protein JHW41_14980 [Lysobacter enzymogenes]